MFHTQEKILELPKLLSKINVWRIKGDTIVFTNGCFDLIHVGHVRYLEEARLLGDKLVLGLNTDTSVQRLKGNSRPVLSEQDRAEVLAAFEFVDAVTLFDEDTPYELIKAVRPDILVKGGDYPPEEIVGHDLVQASGGKVLSLQLVDGQSTTAIIEKIHKINLNN